MKAFQKNYIDRFREELTAGIEGMVRAAEIYVEAIDADPENIYLFQEAFDDLVPRAAWKRFEAVGRKWIHPKMMLGGISDRKKNALIAKLPYSAQSEVFAGKRFDLLTPEGETLKISPLEAPVSQVEQLVSSDGEIRTMASQKAFMVEKQKEPAIRKATEDQMPYIITNGKVTFRRGVTLTRAELKRILQEM